MSGFNKRLPFFEEESLKRDTASWWSCIEQIRGWGDQGLEVIMMVSDRAKALLQLAESDYLATFSMPDLFHFMQDLGKCVGARLGQQVKRSGKKLSESTAELSSYGILQQDLAEKKERLDKYKAERQRINQLIHPFNEQDVFTNTKDLEIQVQQHFTRIRKLAAQAGIDISLEKGQKVLNQIPPLCQGVEHWLQYLQNEKDYPTHNYKATN